MQITSAAFRNGEHLPRQCTRDGEDKSPPLHIAGVPPDTRSLTLIMDDPDAPRGPFTHWIVFDLDPKVVDLDEDQVPENARQGSSDWGQTEYGGPKPPSGEHRYFFRLYALDNKLNLPRGARRDQVERAMRGHVLDQAEFMGRYASTQPQPAGPGKANPA